LALRTSNAQATELSENNIKIILILALFIGTSYHKSAFLEITYSAKITPITWRLFS
jgi:hypothetical protein